MARRAALLALLAAAACTAAEDPAPGGGGGAGGGAAGAGGAPGGSGGSGGGAGGLGGGAGGGTGGTGGAGGVAVEPDVDTGWTPSPPASLQGAMPGGTRPADCGPEHGFFTAVRGFVVAPGGRPIASAKAQFCVHTATRRFICLSPSDSDAEGVYTIELPEEVRCLDRATMRVLLPRAGKATSYCELDPGAGPQVRLTDPSVLFAAPTATVLPPEGDPGSSREVIFDDGLALQVVPSLYYSGTGAYERFGGRRIPTDAVGLCGEAPTFDGLYAFYPEGSISAPGFALTIPNPTGLPAGAAVELFVLGGLECTLLDGTAVPEAAWAKFGEGTVSGDGATITSAADAGLPCFTWLGYRLKP